MSEHIPETEFMSDEQFRAELSRWKENLSCVLMEEWTKAIGNIADQPIAPAARPQSPAGQCGPSPS